LCLNGLFTKSRILKTCTVIQYILKKGILSNLLTHAAATYI
jgi:hypothetical protein